MRSCRCAGGGLGAGGVAGQLRGDLDGHVAVDAVAGVVDRAEEREGALDVVDHEVPVGVGDRRRRRPTSVAELLVVVGARADRLLEDRRVRGEAADAAVDPALASSPLGEPAPAEVVEPRALPELVQLVQARRVASCGRPPGPRAARRARSATCSGVKPSSASTCSPGAEAPKRSMPDGVVGPAVPAERWCRPRRPGWARRAAAPRPGGPRACSAKRSQHGSELTCARDALLGEQRGRGDAHVRPRCRCRRGRGRGPRRATRT